MGLFQFAKKVRAKDRGVRNNVICTGLLADDYTDLYIMS